MTQFQGFLMSLSARVAPGFQGSRSRLCWWADLGSGWVTRWADEKQETNELVLGVLEKSGFQVSWRVSYELIRRSGGDWKVRLVFIGELMSDEEPECRSDEMSSRCVDRSCKDHAHQQPLEHERHRQTPKTKTHPTPSSSCQITAGGSWQLLDI